MVQRRGKEIKEGLNMKEAKEKEPCRSMAQDEITEAKEIILKAK